MMDETKWTPGPWTAREAVGGDGTWRIYVGDIFIAKVLVDVDQPGRAEADARLMAAAPAMAEALRDWVDFFDQLEAQSDSDDPLARARAMYHDQRLRKSRAALAAAEGTGGV